MGVAHSELLWVGNKQTYCPDVKYRNHMGVAHSYCYELLWAHKSSECATPIGTCHLDSMLPTHKSSECATPIGTCHVDSMFTYPQEFRVCYSHRVSLPAIGQLT